MKSRKLLLLLLLAFAILDGICARRLSSFGRSSSKSYSSSSYRSSSGSRGTSSSGSRGTSYGGSHSTSYGGSHSTSYGGSRGTSYGGSHGTSYGGSHGTSSPSRGTSTGTSHGQTSHPQSKDITTSFLNAEGGGATRPAQPKPPSSPFGGSHAPSAPPAPSAPYPHSTSPIGVHPSQPIHPTIGKDSKQTSPYAPSAPPLEHIPKATSLPTQNHAPTSFGQPSAPYNPHLGPNQPSAPGSQPPHVGFKEHLYTPSTSSGVNTRFPTTGANPPYPVHGSHPPYPVPGSHPPYPVHGSNPPYPVHGSNPPYPVHGSNPPYPVHGSNPSYPVHGSNTPYPSSFGGQSFGHPSYQPGAPHNQPPIGNPYNTYQTGSAFAAPGHSQYTPHVLSQPAAQPFVPGQTVIMVPGQQDSGRGLGQIFKEALVFSTVNAAVNRVINPHHHYITETRPDSSGAAPTTHITYNNQYFNTYPGANGTTDGTGAPSGAFAPVNTPVTGVPGVPSAPGSTSSVNVPPASPTSTGVGTVPGVSTTGANTYQPTQGSMGTQANQGTQGTQGTPENVTSTPASYMPQYRISDDELMKISEELFTKTAVNASKYIKLNLQNRTTSVNITDEAAEPLFVVEPELLDYPTIYVTQALYDNYEFDSRKKENRTLEKRKEENLLMDTFLETNTMSRAMQWLAEKGFIDPDDFERKDVLRHIWFNQFDGTTSGFERVFTAEKYGDTDILGVQDWLYFEHQEAKKRINYMGYVDKLDLGDSASLLKLNFEMDGVVRPNATIFVGTLPELEMSLYTICFYARPNNLCPVSLGGTKFNIFTHSFRYYGNDLIDLALPIF